MKTTKYIFENSDVKITVLARLANSALRACNTAIKIKGINRRMLMTNLKSFEDSTEQLGIENSKILLCEWKKD